MIRCLCINDEGRPVEIPKEKWPKKDEQYNITFIAYCLPQTLQGCSLNEIFLDESCSPYEYYKLSRFAIHIEDLEAFIQLCKDCTDLDDVEINALIEQSQLQIME